MSFPDVIICCVMITLALAVAVVPLIIGIVQRRRVVKPVEYFPPRGASPVDFLIEYYGASADPHEIFNPLMLYWAERGFITIEEDCKRGLKLTKIKELERPESNDGFNLETFEIEKRLFEYVFNGGRREVFYTLAASRSFKDNFDKVKEACEKRAKAITEVKSKKYSVICIISAPLMYFLISLVILISTGNNMVLIAAFPLFAILMSKLIFTLPPSEETGIPQKGSAIRIMLIPFFLIAGGLPFGVMVWLLPLGEAIISTVALAVCILIIFFLDSKIDIRTQDNLEFYARICGFKHFLLLAEIEQLEALVEENPQYFYNILPYCYILKITEKLKPKFDSIALDGPAWYLGELRETLMF